MRSVSLTDATPLIKTSDATNYERYGPMYDPKRKYDWRYYKDEFIMGVIVCFAQVPEAISFAFLAHVEPSLALHATYIINCLSSGLGGRPGLVGGATGAISAIVMTFVAVPEVVGQNGEGIELLFPTVMMCGLWLCFLWAFNVAKYVSLIPNTVMIGFCNSLAIIIGMAQLFSYREPGSDDYVSGMELVWMLAITAVSAAIMEFQSKLPFAWVKFVPSSLVALLSGIFLEFVVIRNIPDGEGNNYRTNTLGDVAALTMEDAFPIPFFANEKYDLSKIDWEAGETWKVLIVDSFMMSMINLFEALMVIRLVDDITDTTGNPNRQTLALGVANGVTGFFGGMGGGAKIGLTMLNVLNGARGRTSSLTAAFGVLIITWGAFPLLNFIPLATLAGIMVVVCVHTFKWYSIAMMAYGIFPRCIWSCFGHKPGRVRFADAFTILLVTLLTYFTNLFYSVVIGIAWAAINFAWVLGDSTTISSRADGQLKVYEVSRPLHFAACQKFKSLFDVRHDPANVIVYFTSGDLYDYSAVCIMNELSERYKKAGKRLRVKYHKKTLSPSEMGTIAADARMAPKAALELAGAYGNTDIKMYSSVTGSDNFVDFPKPFGGGLGMYGIHSGPLDHPITIGSNREESQGDSLIARDKTLMDGEAGAAPDTVRRRTVI